MVIEGRSRRALLSGAAIGGAAWGLAGCGTSHSETTTTSPSADVTLLNRALDLEYFAAAAYTAATPQLRGRAHAAAKVFLGQELAHISRLISLIQHAGGKPHQPQPSYSLGHPHGAAELLRLLDSAERSMISGYLEVIPRLSSSTRSSVTAILANEGQHVSVLRIALGRSPVPAPFISGRE